MIAPQPAPELTWLELVAPADEYDEPTLTRIARYVEVSNVIARDYWGDATDATTVEGLVLDAKRAAVEVVAHQVVAHRRLDGPGLRAGDVIQQVNGKSVDDADDVRDALRSNDGKPSVLLIARGETTIFVPLRAR